MILPESEQPPKKIAIAVLVQLDEYLLQYRDPAVTNGAEGMIGAFGGGIEEERDNNDPKTAAINELKEEVGVQITQNKVINFEVEPQNIRWITDVSVMSDRDGRPARVDAEVYEVLVAYGLPVVALEGELRRMRARDITIARQNGQLTPATSEAFKKFYGI
jgi:8-oxo-dGTP pyrophosphatase MutT (NUDIX family)